MSEEGIQTANQLVDMLVDMSEISAADFNAKYPEFLKDRNRTTKEGWEGWQATLIVIRKYARRIKDGRP